MMSFIGQEVTMESATSANQNEPIQAVTKDRSTVDFVYTDLDNAVEIAQGVHAFLPVELYQKVFEQFKGSPLPPHAGLERALVSLGVGEKVKDKARQVL